MEWFLKLLQAPGLYSEEDTNQREREDRRGRKGRGGERRNKVKKGSTGHDPEPGGTPLPHVLGQGVETVDQ